jgi:hypothetical protein
MIGFHKINLHSEDGFDLLPKHMQMNLKSLRPNDPGHNSGFIFYDKESDLKPSFLMHLRPGGLRHHEEEIDLNWEAQKSVLVPVSCTTPSRWKENGVFAQRFSRCIFGASSLAEFTAKEEQILHFDACCVSFNQRRDKSS